MKFPKRGGPRKGAGRPRTRPHPDLHGPGVPHLSRADFPSRHPVHITQRVVGAVGNLRSFRRARLVKQALADACERFGMRVVHYSIQGNHLHLIVEAADATALARGMQGLSIRLAKRLNALARRHGAVFVDRYHAHVLASVREVKHAIRYVLHNFQRHTREALERDPHATSVEAPLAAPSVWLLRVGWRI